MCLHKSYDNLSSERNGYIKFYLRIHPENKESV